MSLSFSPYSYENANDSPSCSGGPKFLKNKQETGVFQISYTYSVDFVVSAIV